MSENGVLAPTAPVQVASNAPDPAMGRQRELLDSLMKDWDKLSPDEQSQAVQIKRNLESRMTQPKADAPTEPSVPEATSPTIGERVLRNAGDAAKGLQLGAAAFAEGVAVTLGAPSDLAEMAVNGLAWLGEKQRPPTPGQPPKPNTVNFPGGAEELQKYLPDSLRVPKDLPPGQAILTDAIRWGASALPLIGVTTKLLSYADPRKIARTEAMVASGAGATAGAFKEIWGDSPVVEFLGGLTGAVGPQMFMKILGKARQVVVSATGLRTNESIEHEIGAQLGKYATPEELEAGVQKSKSIQAETGEEFKPTTAQAVGTPGLIQSERVLQRQTVAAGDKGKRTLASNQAVVRSYLERGAPEGSLADTVKALEATRTQETAVMDAALIRAQADVDAAKGRVSSATQRILQQADERAAAAEDRAQTRINALRTKDGAVIRESDAGRIVRQEYKAELDAFNIEAEKRYEALPDFTLPAEGLRKDLARLTTDFGVELQGPAAAAMAKLRAIIPDVEPPKRPAGFNAAEPAPPAPVETTFHELHQARNEVRRLKGQAIAAKDFKASYQLGELDGAIGKALEDVKAAPPTGAEGAVEALAETDNWYAKGAGRLKAGEAGALRFKDRWGRFVTHDEDVAAQFLDGDTPVNDFVQAIGSRPSAREALRDFAKLDFYKKAVNPDTGEVKQVAAARWMQDHAAALKEFPELASEFGDAKRLQKMATDLRKEAETIARNPEAVARVKNPKVYGELDEVTRRHADLVDLRERTLKDWQKGLASDLMGLDADRAAGAIVRSAQPRTVLADISKKIGSDPDGQAGLNRALWDAALDKFSAQLTDAVGNKVLKEAKMTKFLRENEGWMVERFGTERVERMRTSIKALTMLESTGRPVLPGGSDTFANLSNVLTDWGPFLSRMNAVAAGRSSEHWLIGERALRIIGKVVKGRTEEAATELLDRAFYDPQVAQTLVLASRNAGTQLLEQRFRNMLLHKGYVFGDHSTEETE